MDISSLGMSQHRNSVSETERKSWNEGDASLGAHQISFKEQHLACVIAGFFSQYKVFLEGKKKDLSVLALPEFIFTSFKCYSCREALKSCWKLL